MRTSVGLLAALVAMAQAPVAWAQTPQGTAFAYQGRLTQSGTPASGAYDLRFVLFDASTGGTAVGPTVELEDVTVTEGLFTVSLDFGSVFLGEKRWLELAVRPGAGTGPHTVLAPRQELTPSPSSLFSVAAADASSLAGVPASQYVQTSDPRLSDARVPLPGSPSYIQNGITPQSGNFVVTGTGTANVLAAVSQFNLGPSRILAAPGNQNLFAGIGAGASNTGAINAFFGSSAGQANTTGESNAFFGTQAGMFNTTARNNSFFGALAGRANTTGGGNNFFGTAAGLGNTTGSGNSFFGDFVGVQNTTGTSNSFFGASAGQQNTTGSFNIFVGGIAGGNNTIGSGNTFIGYQTFVEGTGADSTNNSLLGFLAKVGASLSNATALGANAFVSQSNSLVLGGISGVNGGSSTRVGIGTTAPAARLHVADGGSNVLLGASSGCLGLAGLAFAPTIVASCVNFSLYGGDGNTYLSRPPGGAIGFRENGVTQVSIKPGGVFNLQILGTGGSTALCRNGSGDVTTCSSSLRYKEDVESFHGGLEIVERLRPISFTWKDSGHRDLGLAAEEVAEVEPLLAFRNDKGEIEGVNYAQLTAVLVNALRQQEARLRGEIEALRAIVCEVHPQSAPCLQGEGR
jgi:hypothetical protein